MSSTFITHPFLYSLPDPFQQRKGSMPFVEMEDGMFDAQRVQDLGPTDSQDDFLTKPLFEITYVEMG